MQGHRRSGEYSGVVIDECPLDLCPGEGDRLVRRLREAVPVYVNMAISGSCCSPPRWRSPPPPRQERLKCVRDLASRMRSRLQLG